MKYILALCILYIILGMLTPLKVATVSAAPVRIGVGNGLPPVSSNGTVEMGSGNSVMSWTIARGEFEPGVISLLSDSEQKGISIHVEDLVGINGQTIMSNRIRLNHVLFRGVKLGKNDDLLIVPEFLFPMPEMLDLEAGEPTLIWLTISIANDALPGKYTGELIITMPDGHQHNIALETNVLPFRLVESKTVFAMLYTYEFRFLERYEHDYQPLSKRRNKSDRVDFLDRGYRTVKDMAEHGMNTIFPHSGRDLIIRKGKPFVPDYYESLNAANNEGLLHSPGWFVGWQVNAQWKDISNFREGQDVARLKQIAIEAASAARERGFSDCIIIPSDEPNHKRKQRVARKLLQGVGAVEGVRWAVTGNADTLLALSDLYDIAIIAGGTPKEWQKLRKRGHELWLYENNAVTGRSPIWSRFVYGLYGWRAGFDGVTSWTYPACVGNYDHGRIDARDGAKIPVYTQNNVPINTIVWEAVREGIDDRRYIDTLKEQIVIADAAGLKIASKNAQNILKEIWNSVNPHLKSHQWKHTEYGSPCPKGFSWKELDAVRKKIIREIIELKHVNGGQTLNTG